MTAGVLLLTVGIFAICGLVIRGRGTSSQCPTCHVDLALVSRAGDGPNHAYDVLACPTCLRPQTRVHGATSRFAYCPACKNRALTLRCQPTDEVTRAMDVHEQCELCGYEREYELAPEPPPVQCQVIQFPDPSKHRRPRHSRGG